MPDKGYSAYQLYSDIQYQEADKARAGAYTKSAYNCPHSQRAFLGSYDHYQQRTHFDAANTSCCNEPVRPFENKPQYTDTASPAQARDCEKINCEEKCTRLAVGGQRFAGSCADSTLKLLARVRCPNLIPELKGKKKGTIKGDYGTWRIDGLLGKDTLQLTYSPNSSIQQTLYNTCGGTESYTERLGKTKFDFSFHSGLDSPSGCYCDCCGTNSEFTPPTHLWYVDSLTPTWGNTFDIPGTVKLDSACKDGSISGNVNYVVGGSVGLSWTEAPQYKSEGYTRYWEGTPGVIGSSTQPACCGATTSYSGSDGCGWSGGTYRTLARMPLAPAFTPASGTLYAGSVATLQVTGACNQSSLASLSATGTGMNTATWQATDKTTQNIIKKNLGSLAFLNSFQYKGCCGNGQIDSNWNDGCNQIGNRSWPVRNPASTASTLRGSIYRIYLSGGYYYVQRSGLRCDGVSDESWVDVTAFNTIPEAIGYIDSAGDSQIINDSQEIAKCPANNVCSRYVNNGLSDINFQAAIYCVNNSGWQTTPICCTIPFNSNGAWVYQNSSTCCSGS